MELWIVALDRGLEMLWTSLPVVEAALGPDHGYSHMSEITSSFFTPSLALNCPCPNIVWHVLQPWKTKMDEYQHIKWSWWDKNIPMWELFLISLLPDFSFRLWTWPGPGLNSSPATVTSSLLSSLYSKVSGSGSDRPTDLDTKLFLYPQVGQQNFGRAAESILWHFKWHETECKPELKSNSKPSPVMWLIW